MSDIKEFFKLSFENARVTFINLTSEITIPKKVSLKPDYKEKVV